MRITEVKQAEPVRVKVLPGADSVKINASIAAEVVYQGATEFVPGDEDQVIKLEGLKSATDIVIKAVPKDYGKISYNGTTLFIY